MIYLEDISITKCNHKEEIQDRVYFQADLCVCKQLLICRFTLNEHPNIEQDIQQNLVQQIYDDLYYDIRQDLHEMKKALYDCSPSCIVMEMQDSFDSLLNKLSKPQSRKS